MKRKPPKSSDEFSDYLEHPRYGKRPQITGLDPCDRTYTENVFLHWHSQEGVRIPNTAIEANAEKQSQATIPVTHYFDSKRVCRKCGARFIFFANEQRYWYEELGFPIEADLVNCVGCRKHEHQLRKIRQEYEQLSVREDRSEKETQTLIENGVFLVEENVFTTKLLAKLRGFVNASEFVSTEVGRKLMDRMAALEG